MGALNGNDRQAILIADGDSEAAGTLARVLQQEGYEVTVAAGGEEALRRSEEGCFHLLITELQLPDFGGLELMKKMQLGTHPDLVGIVAAAGASLSGALRALNAGAFGCLKKPYDPRETLIQVRQGLACQALAAGNRRLQSSARRVQEEVRVRDEALRENRHRLRVLAAQVTLATELAPDVVIMDVAMPELNGVEATQQIAAGHPPVRVIALSMYAERSHVSRMLEAGASGYLPKDSAFEELAEAIRIVVRGGIYLGEKVSALVLEDYTRRLRDPQAFAEPELTAREREILQLIAEGRSTKEIAFDLQISAKTVETHRRNIMGKLGLSSIAELTQYAIRQGVITLPP